VKYTIYGLLDPRDKQLRYVGVTVNVKVRMNQHCRDCSVGSKKGRWINELKQANLKPAMIELDVIELEEAKETETFYIGYFRMLGCNLTNGTMGGFRSHSITPRIVSHIPEGYITLEDTAIKLKISRDLLRRLLRQTDIKVYKFLVNPNHVIKRKELNKIRALLKQPAGD
jgi:hypothetical protein